VNANSHDEESDLTWSMCTSPLTLLALSAVAAVGGLQWTHRLALDPKFHVSWTPSEEEVTFEIQVGNGISAIYTLLLCVQVATLGYVSLGFSPNGGMKGADMFLAWIDDHSGKVIAHVRRGYWPITAHFRLIGSSRHRHFAAGD